MGLIYFAPSSDQMWSWQTLQQANLICQRQDSTEQNNCVITINQWSVHLWAVFKLLWASVRVSNYSWLWRSRKWRTLTLHEDGRNLNHLNNLTCATISGVKSLRRCKIFQLSDTVSQSIFCVRISTLFPLMVRFCEQQFTLFHIFTK